jgi:putative membrane protein
LFFASYFLLYGFDLSAPITLLIFEILIFVSIVMEQTILRDNPLATFRRLVLISFFTYLVWLLVLIFGLLSIPFSIHYEHYISFLLLGFSYAIAFRLLVIGSIFYGNLLEKAFITFFQPIVLAPILFPIPSFNKIITLYSIPTFGGIAIITSVVFYLIFINRTGTKLIGLGSLELLRAFLSAWAANSPKFIEDFMDKVSLQEKVRMNLIVLDSNDMKIALVVPEVHPGPFYPVGSSNLPFYLQNWFKNNGFSSMIFHGISGHELNLPSKKEVDRFISSLKNLETVASGKTCSIPIIAKVGKATATCIAFGDTVLIMLTLSPFGMEDLPLNLKQKIENLAFKLGYKNTIIVDTHNSQGDIIKEDDCDELIKSAEKALINLRSLNQGNFMAGFAHSSELDLQLGEDIGPAGLGVLVLEINGRKYSIVAVDSNNSIKGLREELLRNFKDSKAPILELCTSDTHFTAGKKSISKGYIALGERTGLKELSEAIKVLICKSLERLAPASFQVNYVTSSVKVIGMELINTLSKVLDKSLSLVKKGGIIIVILSILFLLLTVIFF